MPQVDVELLFVPSFTIAVVKNGKIYKQVIRNSRRNIWYQRNECPTILPKMLIITSINGFVKVIFPGEKFSVTNVMKTICKESPAPC